MMQFLCIFVLSGVGVRQVRTDEGVPDVSPAPPEMPLVRVSPKVMEKGSRVELSCEAPHSLSGAQCTFYTHPSGEVFTQTNSSKHSCVLAMSGTVLLGQRAGRPRMEVGVRCDYQERGRPRSPKSQSVTVVVWDTDLLVKPDITASQSNRTAGESVSLTCASDSGRRCLFYRDETLVGTAPHNREQRSCNIRVSVNELLGDREFSGSTVLSVSCAVELTVGGELNITQHSKAKSVSVTGHVQNPVSPDEPANGQPITSRPEDDHPTTGNDGAFGVAAVAASVAASFIVLAGVVLCLIRHKLKCRLSGGTSNQPQQSDNNPLYSTINPSPQQRELVNTTQTQATEEHLWYSAVRCNRSNKEVSSRVQADKEAEYAVVGRNRGNKKMSRVHIERGTEYATVVPH